MVATIDKLRREHTGMRSILRIIEEQLEQLERQGDSPKPDLVLLVNALHYMRTFPSVVHHPKEELVFGRLIDADAPCRQEIRELEQQHREIYQLEDSLIDAVMALQNGEDGMTGEILSLGRRYITVQRQHAVTEEQIIFPIALQLLTEKDWRHVESKADLIEDPLFGGSVTEAYRALYNYIMQEAARD